ncbi:MAG: hypothetical protein ABH870_05075 [bacterium]
MKKELRNGQRICAVVLAVMMFVTTFAYADIVYLREGIVWLKNESMIKGEIIAVVPGKSYTIQTKEKDKKTFIYLIEDIAKIQIGAAKLGVVEEEEEMLVDITYLPIETICLMDGSKIKGKIFEITPEKLYKIKTTDTVLVYPVEKIEKVKSTESERPEEVVCLKDGNKVLGRIIEIVPGKSYKIRTTDGSDFVIAMDTIEKIEKTKKVELRDKKTLEKRAETTPSGSITTPSGSITTPSGSITTSFGVGIDFFSVEDVAGMGKGVVGDLRFMGKNCGIQFEIGNKTHEGDENSNYEETYKCFSYGATALLLNRVSPKVLFYGGCGASMYSWDNLTETSWLYIGPVSLSSGSLYMRNPQMKKAGCGYHLCGGIEYAISTNLFFCGEIRRIIGTIEEPETNIDYKVTNSYGNTVETGVITITGEDWDYGHTDVRVGLRLSF